MADDETKARIAALERLCRTLGTDAASNGAKLAALERALDEAREVARGAMRRAQESIHEVQGIGQGLIAHLAQADRARADEAERTEKVRSEAAAAHARRFEAQGVAIAGLQKAMAGIAHRGQVSTVLLIISMVLIPALTASAIAILQEWKAPPPAAPALDGSGRPS